jgi:hypothetical protein
LKKIIFILFLFLKINIFLFSQDYEKEYNRIAEIQNCIFKIREIFIFYTNPNHSLENILQEIEENINKIIYDLSIPSYINFESDINSFIYTTLINMLINELNYIKIINKDIHNIEYRTRQFFHTLDNAINLCTMIQIMIALKVQT